MIEYIIREITEKWGELERNRFYICNGKPYYLDQGYFNYIFTPLNLNRIKDYFERNKISVPEELKDLYLHCNGMRLFLSAFSIYGFPMHKGSVMPYDLLIENINIHEAMSRKGVNNSNLLFFGSYAGSFAFAYDMESPREILCMEKGNDEVIMKFSTLDDMIKYFIPRIISKYRSDCQKIEMNNDYLDIPILANSILSLEELN